MQTSSEYCFIRHLQKKHHTRWTRHKPEFDGNTRNGAVLADHLTASVIKNILSFQGNRLKRISKEGYYIVKCRFYLCIWYAHIKNYELLEYPLYIHVNVKCTYVVSAQRFFFHFCTCRCTCENVYDITPDTSYTYMSHPAYGSSSYDEWVHLTYNTARPCRADAITM